MIPQTGTFTISKERPSTKSQDFVYLRERMMDLLEQLGNGMWTDYNLHDPGITILEALIYSITELGLRADLPVDLLINKSDPDSLIHAFSPKRVLPNHAVNRDDFRHISRGIDKVKNAWLLESPVPEVAIFVEKKTLLGVNTYPLNVDAIGNLLRIKGLFDVYFELSDSTLNTNLILVNGGKTVVPATDPILGPINEPYWMEFGLPYWDQFPKDWQKTVTLNSVVVNSLLHNSDANVFTAGVEINYTNYNTLAQSFNFGVVVRATPLATGLATTSEIQIIVSLALQDIFSPDNPYKRLNDKIIAIALQSYQLQKQLSFHRNLCQDFYKFRSIRIQEIAVKTSIELPLPYSIEEICAELFFRLDNFFSPPLQFYSFEELIAKGFSPSELYNGPVNEKGFMPPGQPEHDWTKAGIFTSDLIQEMLAINDPDFGLKRIIAILDFSLSSYVNNYPVVIDDRNCVKVIDGSSYRPVFSAIKSDFRFFNAGAEILYNKEVALQLFINKKNLNVIPAPQSNLTEITGSTTLNFGEYYSIQNDLPPFYGIGPEGLSADATPMRQGQANQLKAYMLLFDQLMANASAQLDQLTSFFSFDPSVKNTYFFKSLSDEVPGFENLLVNPKSVYEQQTAAMLESREQFMVRRNGFLNHLLSIAGEDLSEYESVLLNYYTKKAIIAADFPLLRQKALGQLIQDKNRVLRELPELSADRGLGFSINGYIEIVFDSPTSRWKWKIFDIKIIGTIESRVDLLISNSAFLTRRAAFNHLTQHWKELSCGFYFHPSTANPSFIEVHDRHVADGTSNILAVSPKTFPSPPQPEVVEQAKNEILEIVQRIWHSTNVSGLEKRAGRFLGFRDIKRRNLVNVNYLQYFNIQKQGLFYCFVLNHEDLSFQLQSGFVYGNQTVAEGDLQATALAGTDKINYTVISGATTITITLQNGAVSPPTITIPVNENPDTDVIIAGFIEFFRQYFGPQEGCFMVENLLIRSRIKSAAPGPSLLSTIINKQDVPDHDPYSNRFTLLLMEGELAFFPGQTSRLSDADFKRLVEKTFRQEAPTHLIGDFIWLKEADMKIFQQQYLAWITLQFTVNVKEDAFADIQSNMVDFISLHL